MKKNILFIESPLQLINAYEAVQFFNLKSYLYVVRLSGNPNNDQQLLKVIHLLNLVDFKFLKINAKNKNIFDYLVLFVYKYKYVFFGSKIEKIFIGNFESKFLSLIVKQFSKEKIILLDDGAKTISIQNKFNKHKYYDLFTLYSIKAIPGQNIYQNKYPSVLEKLESGISYVNNNKILFIGSKLSEIGIVKEKYYLMLVQDIANFYQGFEIIYVPHREECKEKLQIIADIININVYKIDYPIELFGLYEKEMPFKVSSFYSTALITMKNIYQIEAEAFTFDYSQSKHKKAIAHAYDYYRHEMNIINLSSDV